MKTQIRPCPFCNSKNVELFIGYACYYVECKACDVRGPVITRGSIDFPNDETIAASMAVKSWNREEIKTEDLI